jgi:hypothetical protein
MVAKNKSYLELKAIKDVEQIKENRKLQEGKHETKTTNRRKK